MSLRLFVFVTVLSLLQQEILGAGDKIFCYYASWGAARSGNGKVAANDLDPFLCTHIFYAFLALNENGNLDYMDPTKADVEEGYISNLATLKQKNPKLKLIFSVGGAAASAWTFNAVAKDPQKLNTLVQSTLDYIQKYNFDGIDIDWEYPFEKAPYITMLKALKDQLGPKGYLVATAVAYNPVDVAYDVPAMNEVLDLINVMSYDFHASWGGQTGQNSPLYASHIETPWQQSALNGNGSIWNWRNAGAAPEKLALGAGFYGHAFKLQDPNSFCLGCKSVGAWEQGPYTQNWGTLGYSEICEFHADAEEIWDEEQQVPIKHKDTFWVGYDNERSLIEKVKYVKEHNLAGIMVWSIETDDSKGVCGKGPWPLLNAINQAIKN